MLSGYEETGGGFKLIRNRKIFWMNDKCLDLSQGKRAHLFLQLKIFDIFCNTYYHILSIKVQ